ncbi:MAG: DUF3006 domain-containing protein [Oscillospiraceae bacterium]|jgi:hypothetical protein|nr:DUF3006 domain-containing protein [Oscillospiraceae bacterium]
MKFLYLDRFDGAVAVCEDDDCKTSFIKKKLLPRNADVGCVLRVEDNGRIIVDEKETKSRLKLAKDLEKKLFDKHKK